jgi:hypothetical protein
MERQAGRQARNSSPRLGLDGLDDQQSEGKHTLRKPKIGQDGKGAYWRSTHSETTLRKGLGTGAASVV